MAYTITLTNGTTVATVADGSVDTTNTSLSLLGRNYIGYGTIIADNFVRILENFANVTPPVAPLTGQLWFENDTGALMVWNGTAWISAAIPPNATFNTGINFNTGFIMFDLAAPANDRRYRIRVTDLGTWVLEALNDDLSVKATPITVSHGTNAVNPNDVFVTGDPNLVIPASDNSTRFATTAFIRTNYAPLASPALTGTPTAPTQLGTDNSTRLATTAHVHTSYAPLASPALTGNPTAPTQTATDNSTRLATTAYVHTSYAPLVSPSFTGSPATTGTFSVGSSLTVGSVLTCSSNISAAGNVSATASLVAGDEIIAGVNSTGDSVVRFTKGLVTIGYIFRSNSTDVVTISSSNTPLQGLSVDGNGNTVTTGNMTAAGNAYALAYPGPSDYRLKLDFGPATGIRDLINSMIVHDGAFKNDIKHMHKPDLRRPMLIAHELQEFAPWAVHGEKDAVGDDGRIKPQGIDHMSLVPVLIASNQDLIKENTALVKRVDAMEKILQKFTSI